MIYPIKNGFSHDSGNGEGLSPAEATLRLVAQLPVPEGLEDRVHAALRSAPRSGRVLAWPVSLRADWMRAAAAAAIVFVVAGGGWGIYSRVQPGQTGQGIVAPRSAAPGQFSTGDAMRRPQTLQGPVVAHPVTTIAPKAKAPAKTVAVPVTKTTTAGKQAAPTAVPVVAH